MDHLDVATIRGGHSPDAFNLEGVWPPLIHQKIPYFNPSLAEAEDF